MILLLINYVSHNVIKHRHDVAHEDVKCETLQVLGIGDVIDIHKANHLDFCEVELFIVVSVAPLKPNHIFST